MHPPISRPLDVPRTPTRPARPARPARPTAAHRALPTRRLPRAVELADAGSGAVLAAVLDGLRAVPDKPVLDLRTRLHDLLRTLRDRVDLSGLALVAGAGGVASIAFTAVLLLWLASIGRLG